MKWFQTTGIYSLPEMIPKIILIFFIFSFIGWLCEVIYVGFIFEHRFINRGFLFGPICPIYGIAGVLMLFFPEKLQHSVILLFFSGVVICTAVEYISSFLLEKLFHTTWWDYSNKQIQIGSTIIKLNLNGRICLQNSLLFGIMTVIGIKFVFPFIQKIISSIPENFTKYFAIILSIIFIFDLIFTVKSLIDFNKYIYKIKTLGTNLEEKFHKEEWFNNDSLKEIFISVTNQFKTKKEKFDEKIIKDFNYLKEKLKNTKRYINKFPTMKSHKYKEVIPLLQNDEINSDKKNRHLQE